MEKILNFNELTRSGAKVSLTASLDNLREIFTEVAGDTTAKQKEETPTLRKIKKYNADKMELEIAAYCSNVMERLDADLM